LHARTLPLLVALPWLMQALVLQLRAPTLQLLELRLRVLLVQQ
jgi:hypothetical protein